MTGPSERSVPASSSSAGDSRSAVAAVVQLAEELVDEVAPVGEDEDAAGARGLDEAHRGDGLAGAGRVLEPEALVGVGVVGGALLDVLVDVGLGVVLPDVLGLVVVLVSLVGSSSSSSSSSSSATARARRPRRPRRLELVVLVVGLVGLVRRAAAARARARRRPRARGSAVGAATPLPVLDGGQQRGQRARERVDLVGVQQRAVGQARLVLAEHALETEQQRVAPAPSGRGHLGAGVDLAQRVLERAAAGASQGRARRRGPRRRERSAHA